MACVRSSAPRIIVSKSRCLARNSGELLFVNIRKLDSWAVVANCEPPPFDEDDDDNDDDDGDDDELDLDSKAVQSS